ncbi:hypothetical protein ACODT3_38985 [Streptomyces sp. 4.24]|uniref:hypothetical protein n=1 Tax=Streptomyces tritrimontium TaxID=3406573 RepID=UPI003BB5AF45
MNQEPELIAAVTLLSKEHVPVPFPEGLAGADRAGFDLVMVDADICGCVESWLRNAGSLDDWRLRMLHWRMAQLGEILPVLGEGDSPAYWQRLFRMGELVAATDPTPRDGVAATDPRPGEPPLT